MTHVALIGGPRPMHAAVLARARVTLVERRSRADTADLRAGHARLLVVDDEERPETVAALVAAVHAADPVEAVVCLHDEEQLVASVVAAHLGLPFLDAQPVLLSRDKARMRERLRECGVEDIASAPVTGLDALRGFGARVGYPVIVKPLEGQGSLHVTEIVSEEAAVAHWPALSEPGLPLVAEERLRGPEISVECVSEAGRHRLVAITGKTIDPASFVELGHVVPAPLGPAFAPHVFAHVQRVLDALGITDGPSHTEVILTERGPRTVETHTRVGGDGIARLVELATDLPFVDLVVRQALGERVLDEIKPFEDAPRAAALRFAFAPATGRVTRISGIDEARAVEGVVDVTVRAAVGERVERRRHHAWRPVAVTALGADSDEAVRRAEAALDRVHIEVEPEPRLGPAAG
ncbi:ATP-grasp domain-containing protein [Streptomyces sp. NBC_00239]|uniref:ATP-grasp domain-containing protein n=1 Tax=Streptomyces sp. NBC_00239 TaxID=2903640 RepID=UPI002E2998B6|nr:ATP-grasp domain-containing protein [Streptomyces sp. NBC_00239]